MGGAIPFGSDELRDALGNAVTRAQRNAETRDQAAFIVERMLRDAGFEIVRADEIADLRTAMARVNEIAAAAVGAITTAIEILESGPWTGTDTFKPLVDPTSRVMRKLETQLPKRTVAGGKKSKKSEIVS